MNRRWSSLALLLATAAWAEKPKLMVLDFSAAGGLDPSLAAVLTESAAGELARQGNFDVISSREVAALLGVERQKQLLGCSTDGAACMAELGNALGAKFVVTGSVAILGELYQLNLQSLDTITSQVLGRSSFLAKSIEELRGGLPWLVARATNTPAPAERSRIPGFLTIGAGGVVLLAGGLYGLQTWNREQQLTKELTLGNTAPVVLKSLDYYQTEAEDIRRDKTVALVAITVGAAAMLGGYLFLLPKTSAAASQAALLPTENGVALVGAW